MPFAAFHCGSGGHHPIHAPYAVFRQHAGQPGGNLWGTLLCNAHQFNTAAGKLTFRLDKIAAVHPEGSVGSGDGQCTYGAVETGKPASRLVAVGQVFTHMGV